MIETAPKRGQGNWIGVHALYWREVKRFLKIFPQTLLAPLVSSLLFLAIFAVAFGGADRVVAGTPFIEFLAPGLILMATIQNAFANVSNSLMMAKLNENIVDTLMPPLTPSELILGIAMGGATRGILVAIVVGIGMAPFVSFTFANWPFILFHGVAASLILSLIGVMTAIWADKFDHVATITNFIVIPLTFMSGAFFSIERLPYAIQIATRLNPFFYMIDGFRFGFIGRAESSLPTGIIVVTLLCLAFWIATHMMFARGYKLKA
jgi:ABC-2 type transport system permease protein